MAPRTSTQSALIEIRQQETERAPIAAAFCERRADLRAANFKTHNEITGRRNPLSLLGVKEVVLTEACGKKQTRQAGEAKELATHEIEFAFVMRRTSSPPSSLSRSLLATAFIGDNACPNNLGPERQPYSSKEGEASAANQSS